MTLAVLGHQPYREVAAMSQQELDTLHEVILDLNEAKGGKSRGIRNDRQGARRP